MVMATETPIDLLWEKWYLHLFSVILLDLHQLAGIQDRCKISDEFKFQPNWIIHFSLMRPWALEKFLIDYNGKMMSPCYHVHYWSDLCQTCRLLNQDWHKIADEFEFWPNQTSYFIVICPWLLTKTIDDIVQGIVLFHFLSDLYETCRWPEQA